MTLRTLMTGAAIAALVGAGAIAQETGTTADPAAPTVDDQVSENPAMVPTFTSIEEMTVADVVGSVAYDPEGERIAEIDYVTMVGGEPHVVLGIGGFIGLAEYTVSVPLTDLELREDGSSFLLSTDRETLQAMPEIDEGSIENLPGDMLIAELLPAAPTEGQEETTEQPEAVLEGSSESDG